MSIKMIRVAVLLGVAIKFEVQTSIKKIGYMRFRGRNRNWQ